MEGIGPKNLYNGKLLSLYNKYIRREYFVPRNIVLLFRWNISVVEEQLFLEGIFDA